MTDNSSLVSIIKIEPEEFQTSKDSLFSPEDDILRRKAKIFSDPVLLLERLPLIGRSTRTSKLEEIKKARSIDGRSISDLARAGNEGKTCFEPHNCSLCRKILAHRGALKTHLMIVHGKGPQLFCDLCPKTFQSKAQMAKHVRNHMKKAFACNICDFKTIYRICLEHHKKTHLKQEKCKICNKHVAVLRQHLRNHQKEACPICNKIITKSQMRRHIKLVHDAKYNCLDCSSTFSTKKALRRHKLENHYEGKLHRCHCGSVFKTKGNLESHQLVHESREIICKVCKQKFKHPISFQMHWRKMHSKTHGSLVSSKVVNFFGPFVCDKCGEVLSTRQSLGNHFRYYHSNIHFSCDLCPKNFKLKYIFEDHMRSHSKINPFTCKVCDQTMASKYAFNRHMLIHEPKTECKVCHKMVTNLYEHMTNHVKVKCPICAITVTKPWLPKHIKTMHKSKELK